MTKRASAYSKHLHVITTSNAETRTTQHYTRAEYEAAYGPQSLITVPLGSLVHVTTVDGRVVQTVVEPPVEPIAQGGLHFTRGD